MPPTDFFRAYWWLCPYKTGNALRRTRPGFQPPRLGVKTDWAAFLFQKLFLSSHSQTAAEVEDRSKEIVPSIAEASTLCAVLGTSPLKMANNFGNKSNGNPLLKKSKCSPATEKERAWIARFKKLAADCPKSLWLFSASGTLCVMKSPKNGLEHGGGDGYGVNQENMIDTIDIRNDGGDW